MNRTNSEQLDLIRDKFIEKTADNMSTFGVSTTVGRVLGIIYMNRAPMTLDQLSERTGMSKTRMSQVIREMVQHNIVEKVFQKGVRKDLYMVEDNYHQVFISLFTSNWREAINKSRVFEKRVSDELAKLGESSSLSDDEEETLDELTQEIQLWKDYYNWLYRLVEFLESGEVFKHVPIHDSSHSNSPNDKKDK
ncbi:DNA-binding transcriptional regulator GbsR (MarR family) [Gracilibacillus halotolerans]|uniref:HTH-type transcriptional regulator n=1 Tax=Gracilibacillus halotolerans TaxID=74386 RepID=A0A841RE87_9BACI|nr:GbsR/MarR family transcriptional regulator [Gracilibacillus halotolerans]MBB6512320.1 DNA-binding transcriptional regulator GbsR (MarR family) [Gracilibacillus halotolerans]